MKHLPVYMGTVGLLFLTACGGGSPLAKPSTPSPTPSTTKSGPQFLIAEHISYSFDDNGERCLEVPISEDANPTEGIAGLDALKLAWGEVETKRVDGGVILCTLGGFGAEGCRSDKGKWRHFIAAKNGKTTEATSDPTAYRVRPGEVDAWIWIPREGPEDLGIGTDFEEICRHYL